MTALITEHTQYVDDSGKPIVGGKLYIGLKGADPVATSPGVEIYADRELTIPTANPQILGADGRTTDKIWVDGEYSIQVNSVVGLVETQEFQDLDAGQGVDASATLEATNVIGFNEIEGTTAAALSTLSANQQFVFTTVGQNTATVSLNIDGTGLRPVVKNRTKPILPGEFENDQVVIVAYNEEINSFEWVNQNNRVIDYYIGSNVPAAATTDIWVIDGNTLTVTGTTGITSFGTAPSVGARRVVLFDNALTLTHSANLSLPGNQDYTTEAGDRAVVYANTDTQFDVVIYKTDGRSVVEVGVGVDQSWQDVSGSRTLGTTYQNTSGSPIMVAAQWADGGSAWVAYLNVSSNGSTWLRIGSAYHGSVVGETNPLTCIVPVNGYYRIGSNSNGSGNSPGSSLINWTELT